MTFDVVTFGEPMVLHLADGARPLPTATVFEAGIAGAESNVAIGLARLGHRVGFFGRVGADTFGSRIRQVLRGEGVSVDHLIDDPTRPTGLLIRDCPQGQPITVEYRRNGSAASALEPADVPHSWLTATRLLHVTGITPALSESALAATEQAMLTARAADAEVSFDPNIRLRLASPERWRVIVDQLARHATIVFTGQEEADMIAPGIPPGQWYADRGATTVVVKNGAAGSSEYDCATATTTSVGIRPVPVIDPVGAGDAFNAGWISAWLDGADADQAQRRLTTGATVASAVVATRGDVTGFPTRTILHQLLINGTDVIR